MKWNKFSDKGQSVTELAIILSLVVIVVVMSLRIFGVSIAGLYCQVLSGLGNDEACNNIFQDLFDDGLDDWYAVNGNWRNEDGKLCGGPGEGKIFQDVPYENYVINVPNTDLSKGNGYGIFFRANDYDNVDGYNFQFDPGYGGGAFLMRKWVDGKELSPLTRNLPSGFDWYSPHDIQIRVNGNTFTTFVDGQQVAQVSDNSYSGKGGVGFRTWDSSSVCFDSISVKPLP